MNTNFKKNNLPSENPPPRLVGGQAKTYNLQPSLHNLKPNLGFTLVEMLVSISVFMVVMTVAAGSLLSIIDANGKAQSLKSAVNNLNFAIESMGKQIREGSNYTGGINCSPSPADTCISFTSSKDLNGDLTNDSNDAVTYRYNNNSIERCLTTTSGPSCSYNNGTFTSMTAKGVIITDMKFYISNISELPQRVLITINGEAGTKTKLKTKFNLQTTVSQRSY